MAAIKQKVGQCIDCEPGPDKPLIAKRCNFHYWKYRNSLKPPAEDKFQDKKLMDIWFAEQVNQLPKCCENCGEPLIQFAPWAAKAYIAHIVPKRLFISVKRHPLNRMFLCLICHTNYDNWGDGDKISSMPVFGLLVERFMTFRSSIADDEWKHLPGYLIDAAFDELNTVYGKP